jgi:Tfp pilus assembly protein PilO
MNKAVLTQVIRSFLPELAIGSACCAAGYFFLVDPLTKQVADAQAEVDTLTLAITRSQNQAPVAADSARAAFARSALDAIALRSALAADQARLLQAVSTLADSCSVRVEQFNPATARGRRPIPGQSAVKPDPKIEQRTALSISLTGTYANTARFVRSMQQDVGFTTVRTLRLVPNSTATPDMVSVVIDTEHVAVNTKALAAAQQTAAPASALPGQSGQHAAVPTEHRQ